VVAAVGALSAVLAAGCGGGGRDGGVGAEGVPRPRPTVTIATSSTTIGAPATTATTTTTNAPAATNATPAPTTTVVSGALRRAGSAGQAIVVTAAGPSDTTAELVAYEQGADGWRPAFGPWTARIGYNGFAPPGEKREGDGRTPSGTFGFDFMFGIDADPGVHFPYRTITGTTIVWDDDPASAHYNEWVDTGAQDAGTDPEPMYKVPAYDHGVVIAYNTDRAPGLGSAIFLHVSTGGATAGCVSLPADQLVTVLRWLDPARSPVIVMGTRDEIG
jgi:L,D-peptidoglycan transpeptidase YkuD (ErfK/YbiS/YcfS/YnhG family)